MGTLGAVGGASDRDFLDLLMRRFAGNFSYDTKLDLPETNALDSFFFESRSGYCAYFATAMATALRAAGIEANIVMGYLGGTWNGYGGFWTVRNADAHAWVEARLDGEWQRFDPDPRGDAGACSDHGHWRHRGCGPPGRADRSRWQRRPSGAADASGRAMDRGAEHADHHRGDGLRAGRYRQRLRTA